MISRAFGSVEPRVLGVVVVDGVAVLVAADVFVCWAKVGKAKLIANVARPSSKRSAALGSS